MDEIYKKCPNGHFYKSDLEECPYCDKKTLEDAIAKIIRKPREKLEDLAMCYLMGPDFKAGKDD
jgi:hypothetical protein